MKQELNFKNERRFLLFCVQKENLDIDKKEIDLAKRLEDKKRRLKISKQYLSDTKMTITKIAEKCCFCDSSAFSKSFAEEFRCTPSYFRKVEKAKNKSI